MNRLNWGWRLLSLLLLALLMPPQLNVQGASDRLRVWVGNLAREVDSRLHRELPYYQLGDLASILKMKVHEEGNQITLTGPRGQLVLTDERPLVRLEDQYLLLSSPVWKRKNKEWYVPQDFLVKGLPHVLRDRLEQSPDGDYRLVSLGENGVQVEVRNYPDHVSVIFQSDQKVPIRVREFHGHIEVEFLEKLVRPQLGNVRPDPRLVSGVDFQPFHPYGSFHVQKGRAFSHFRRHQLTNPDRLVVDVYGEITSAAAPVSSTPVPPTGASEAASEAVSATTPTDQNVETVRKQQPAPVQTVIILDPGHGGSDYGIHALQEEQELMEKYLTLNLARKMEKILADRGRQVQFTRVRDVNLATEQRSSVANFYQSALFLSLHFGGTLQEKVRGPIVYTHAFSGTASAKGDREEQPAATPPSASRTAMWKNGEWSAKLVAWELGQRAALAESRRLAEDLQRELNLLFGTSNSPVEAPLAVLAPVSAPAVLIEAGFLSHPEDRRLLSDPEFQDRLAETVVKVLDGFLK